MQTEKLYTPRKVYIAKSKIHGNGVFANKNLKRGEIIFVLKGKIKNWKVKDLKTSLFGPNWIGIKHGTWIDPRYPFDLLNHSCNPNMGIRGKLLFVALRDIRKGEELNFDYSTTEDDLLWRMKCSCGAKNCRKIIHSVQSLPKNTFHRYLPYISAYFQKVYNAEA